MGFKVGPGRVESGGSGSMITEPGGSVLFGTSRGGWFFEKLIMNLFFGIIRDVM